MNIEAQKKYQFSDKGKVTQCRYNANKGRATHKNWRYSPKGKRSLRNSRLKCKFGITIDDFEAILLHQGGGCALCGVLDVDYFNKKGFHLAVDHNHDTGKVRGILCHRCNHIVFGIEEGQKFIDKLMEYLDIKI